MLPFYRTTPKKKIINFLIFSRPQARTINQGAKRYLNALKTPSAPKKFLALSYTPGFVRLILLLPSTLRVNIYI